MISMVDYEFSPKNKAARDRARTRYLRDNVRALRRAVDAIKSIDEPVLDVLLLQTPLTRFARFERGWCLPDDDMQTKAIGPLGELLHRFDVFRDLNIDEVERLLVECETKIAATLEAEKNVEGATREHFEPGSHSICRRCDLGFIATDGRCAICGEDDPLWVIPCDGPGRCAWCDQRRKRWRERRKRK